MSEGFVATQPELPSNSPRQTAPVRAPRGTDWRAWGMVLGLAILWWLLWHALLPLANWITFQLLGLTPGSRLGDAVAFFIYDVPKILLLLGGMIFLVSTARTFFSVERTRQLLGGKGEGVGNVLTALLGVW